MPITLQNTTIDGITGTLNGTNLTLNSSQVYSRGNINAAVGQSSGVPTGGIFEYGSNGNGNYTKYADGTQICTFRYTVGTIASQGAYNWTFPVSFASGTNLVVSVCGGFGFADYCTYSSQSLTTTSVSCYYIPTAAMPPGGTIVGQAHDLQMIAIGRWY